MANPQNPEALAINAKQCEAHQDWGEAARFFLAGIGHNGVDSSMEQGYQTNIDMLRAHRFRFVERKGTAKPEDILAFRPRAQKQRDQDARPPWWRLGPKYEELVQEAGYIADLLDGQEDAEEQRAEVRRVLYQQSEFLDVLFAYYRADKNENWPHDKHIPGQIRHDGHEDNNWEEPMRLQDLWRICKECRLAYGDVKAKMPLAVFDRIFVQGKCRFTRKKAANASYDFVGEDPHFRLHEVTFYDMVETLVRIANLRLTGPLSSRVEALIKDFLRPLALRKQADRGLLDFRNHAVQEFLREPTLEARLRRCFDYFVGSYKANRLKNNAIGPQDITMSFNHVYVAMERMNIYDPNYNLKKCVDLYCKVTCDSDLLPQEHPNNQNSEMIFNEFLDFLVRTARVKGDRDKAIGQVLYEFINDEFIPKAARVIPGKI